MSYISSIKTAIFIFPIIAFLFTIPFILHQYHKYGSINKLRVLIIYSFILYMMSLYFLVILPLPDIKDVLPRSDAVQLIPFQSIIDFINKTSLVLNNPSTYLKAIKEPVFYTVIFNIFMTIPFGMYLRYYFKCSLKKTLLLSFLLSLFFEVTQLTGLYFIYPCPYRVFDVDDLITNTLGGVLGYFIMGVLDNHLPTREQIDEDSIEVGKTVSGLRRITVFCLDLFIFMFIVLIAGIFGINKYAVLTIFTIYYIIVPVVKNGQTFGSKFLNVRIEFPNHKIIRTMLRIIFLFSYYFVLPFGFIYVTSYITNLINLNTIKLVYLYFGYLIMLLLFYPINMLIIIIRKKIFYDKIFKVIYISTIQGNNNSNDV